MTPRAINRTGRARFSLRGLTVMALAVCLAAGPCPAAAETPEGPAIHVNISPENKRREEAYQAAIKNLTDAQKQQLEKITNADRVAGMEPLLALEAAKRLMVRCLEARPPGEKDLLRRQAALLDHYLGPQYHRNHVLLDQKGKALDFIDTDTLRGKIAAGSDMTIQLALGMAALIAQKNSPEEACRKFNDSYNQRFTATDTAAAARPASPASVQATAMRAQTSGAIQDCIFNWHGDADDGRRVTGVTVFGAGQPSADPDEIRLSFSLRLHGTDGKPVRIGTGWINYGGVDTRRIAYHMDENTEIAMGYAHPGAVAAMIGRMARDPLRFMVTDAATGKPYGFTIDRVPAAKINVFASCAATLREKTALDLREAGISFSIDPGHAEALKKHTGDAPVYKTTALSGDPDDPGGCALETPSVRQDSREYGAALIIYGPSPRNGAMQSQAHIWLLGTHGGTGGRISFTDGRAVLPAADGHPAWDSRAVEAGRLSGQRYEIHLPFHEGGRLFEGLRRGAGRITATASDVPGALEIPLPRISAAEAGEYLGCLKNMMKQKPAGP